MMQRNYEVFTDWNEYNQARKANAANRLCKGKIGQLEAKLDTLYVMDEMPPVNEGHARALKICIEAREEELARLNRQ
jgi:hypothetical protein